MEQDKIRDFIKYCILFIFLPALTAANNSVTAGLFPSKISPKVYNIDEIRFSGNKSFSNYELSLIIGSKATNLSFEHQIANYFDARVTEIETHPLKPQIKKSLEDVKEKRRNEYGFFRATQAETDSRSLWNYYNINGFHEAEVSYKFFPDSSRNLNILEFKIIEGDRFRLRGVDFIFTDSGYTEIYHKLEPELNSPLPGYFSEDFILTKANRIMSILVNDGYYFAEINIDSVEIDLVEKSDSVTVRIGSGARYKIGKIRIVDSTRGQKLIVGSLKRQLLEIDEGAYYNRQKVRESENNLNSLGVFDIVRIEGESFGYSDGDSLVNMLVFTGYRPQQEYDAGIFVNRTRYDNQDNIGFEASYTHKNIGGAAQQFNPFLNVALKELPTFGLNFLRALTFQWDKMQEQDFEVQAGFRFQQPLLWEIDNSKIGFGFNPLYSFRSIIVDGGSDVSDFKLSTLTLPSRFQIRLPGTFFNQWNVDVSFERQEPQNFENISDIDTITASLLLYEELDNYLNDPLNDETRWFTSNIIGTSVISDYRDHPFSPRTGHYVNIGADGWNLFMPHPAISGLSKFIRFQFTGLLFKDISRDFVLAFKGSLGHTVLIEENTYVPFERQFFAGGANSNRGFKPRELHYSKFEQNYLQQIGLEEDVIEELFPVLSNVLGNRSIVEFSAELRYQIPRPKGLGPILAEQLSNIGFVTFVDAGNAYGWYTESEEIETDTKLRVYEYFTKMAWSWGVGARYNTPIGPIRLDLAIPVYRPYFSREDYRITGRVNALKELQFHIGIGHAF